MSVLSTASRILPPPNYLRLPSAGVDISDSSVKYIIFTPDSRRDKNLKIAQWGDIDIPAGVLNRGTVADKAQLATVLKEVKEKAGTSNIRVSLPEERAYLFETEIKRGTPLKEIRGLLEFKLEENVPLSPRDAFFDYDIIDPGSSSNTLRVSVTAYARETIMNYYDACVEAGTTPLAFEVEAAAIARATLPQPDSGTHLIIDFGKTRSGIGIVHHGVLMYTSTIDIGGLELSNALSAAVGALPESEFTKLKNTVGLVRGANDSTVHDALLPVMQSIADEIQVRINYWHSKSGGQRDIESIVLCGGSVNMKGLPGYFSDVLKIPAARADVWRNVLSYEKQIPPIERRYSYGYATAIGLALAPFQ